MTDQRHPDRDSSIARRRPAVRPLTCPACGGEAEQGPSYGADRRITCFFCGYEGPEYLPDTSSRQTR